MNLPHRPVLPYGLLLLAASVVLAWRYARIPGASRRSKYVVCGCAATALLVPWGLLTAALLQLAVSVYGLLYLKATADDG